MIGKLNIDTPSIAVHRANVKVYIDYKTAQKRIKAHELSLIKNAVTNKKKRSKKIIRYSVINPETWKTILETEKSAQAKKEANVKKAAQKKDQSAKKKAAAEAKKIVVIANRAINKTAKAAEETKKNNNRKGKKAGHSQSIKNPKGAIQNLFCDEAETIEKDVIEQLNAELQAITIETSRLKS
jgi:hypothetical protein